jgi:hypothetical protein
MTAQLVFLLIFVVLQILDIWTTLKALKMGCREMNPVLAKAFNYAEPLVVMIVIKLAGVFALWWVDMYALTGVMCAMYLWVVNNNLDVIQAKQK